MKTNYFYTLTLVFMMTVVIYSLTEMVSFSITVNTDGKATDFINLFMTSISAISTVAAVTIAYLAYRQWHKPNNYVELLKTRKNLLNNLREIHRIGFIINDTIRSRIIASTDNFRTPDNEQPVSRLSDEEKSILLEEFKQYRKTTLEIESLITDSIKERTILFYNSPKDLENKIDIFLRREQGRINIINHSIELAEELFDNNIEEEKRHVILDILRVRLKHINKLLSSTQNRPTVEEIRSDIERELKKFASS